MNVLDIRCNTIEKLQTHRVGYTTRLLLRYIKMQILHILIVVKKMSDPYKSAIISKNP